MAVSYKNIVITPNISNTADPKIVFSGANSTVNTDISMFVYPAANGTLSFEGTAGQLFSVTNDLSNSLFSVSDISGIPSMEIFANSFISIAPLGGRIGVGNTTPASRVVIQDSVTANAVSSLELNPTWIAGANTVTGLKMNVTDTSSNVSSLLADFQVAGASKATISKSGYVQATRFINFDGSGNPRIYSAGNGGWWIGNDTFVLGVDTNGLVIGGEYDLFLTRRGTANLRLGRPDAASPVAQTLSVQSVVAGTTDIAGANLTIQGSQGTGTGAGGAILFQVAPAGTTANTQNALANAMIITSAGFVGISTASPTTTFDVRGTTDQYSFQVPSTGSARYVRSQTGLASFSGYNLGLIHLSGTFDSFGSVYNGAMLGALNAAAWSNTNSSAHMIMLTTSNGSTTPSEKVRITSNGEVGIGNTTPSHKLSVNGGIYFTPGDTNRIWSGSDNLRLGFFPQIQVSDTLLIFGGQQSISFGGTGGYATIGSNVPWDFVKTTTAQAIRIHGTYTDASNYERLLVSSNSTASYVQAQAIGTGTARPLYLGANSATVMAIAANGNVGVGTTSPTSTLHVTTTSNSQFRIDGRSSGTIQAYQTASQYMNFAIADNGGRGITITTQPNELAAGDSTAYLAAIASGIVSGVTLSTKADSDGNHMSLRARGELVVYTNSGTTSLIERMRVAANGNVGIGNTTPTNKLSVAGTIADQSGDVRSTPINSQSASYTIVTSDNGKTISITTGGVIVDATGITSGQIFSIFNNSNTNQTITQSANSTMYLAGTNTTGNRTLTQYGVATVMCVAANTFVISGAGLS